MLLPLTIETVLLFSIMALMGSGNGSVFQIVPQRFSKEIGLVTGLVGAAGGLGGFLLPSLLGTLKDTTGSYGSGFLVYTVAAAGCVLLILAVRNGWQKTWAGEGGRARTDASIPADVHIGAMFPESATD